MTADEIAKLRALCAVKGGKCPVVLHENGGPLCAAREALPAVLNEIERLRALLARVVKYATEDRATTPGTTRLARVVAEIRTSLGLDQGAGVAK